MGIVHELYTPLALAANGSNTFPEASGLAGFVCTTTGVLDVTVDGNSVLTAMPVTAGVPYFLGIASSGDLAITLSAGAAGTVLVVQ